MTQRSRERQWGRILAATAAAVVILLGIALVIRSRVPFYGPARAQQEIRAETLPLVQDYRLAINRGSMAEAPTTIARTWCPSKRAEVLKDAEEQIKGRPPETVGETFTNPHFRKINVWRNSASVVVDANGFHRQRLTLTLHRAGNGSHYRWQLCSLQDHSLDGQN